MTKRRKRKAARPLWAKTLSTAEWLHLKETTSARPTLRALRANIEGQARTGVYCELCSSVYNTIELNKRGR